MPWMRRVLPLAKSGIIITSLDYSIRVQISLVAANFIKEWTLVTPITQSKRG